MITFHSLRSVIRILLSFIDRALKKGYEINAINKTILFDVMSSRHVAEMTAISHQTINRTASKLLAVLKDQPSLQVLALSDQALFALFYPKLQNKVTYKRRPPFELILKEANKRPKKLALKTKTIYLQYREEDPETALGPSQFFTLVSQELRQHKIEHIFEYTPGEIAAADYAGAKLKYYPDSPKTVEYLYVFVCVMAYSNKIFAFATKRHTAKDWINGLIAAFKYFGGCPFTLHVDNGEVVKKPGLIAELNEYAECFANHYKIIVDTSRVGRSQDNAKAEKGVQHVTYRIIAAMRRLHFTSIEEVNDYLAKEVEKLNNEPMQRIKRSRNELFDEHEKPVLKDLPKHDYRPFDHRFTANVAANATITYKGNRYSLPYTMRNQRQVIVEITDNTLVVIDNHKIVASHTLCESTGQNVLDAAHQSPQQNAQMNKNKQNFLSWAKEIDQSVVPLVEFQYKKVNSDNSAPAGKACLKLQKLYKKFGAVPFILACRYAQRTSPEGESMSAKEFEMVLETAIYAEDQESVLPQLVVEHKNIRGADYYAKN